MFTLTGICNKYEWSLSGNRSLEYTGHLGKRKSTGCNTAMQRSSGSAEQPANNPEYSLLRPSSNFSCVGYLDSCPTPG